ncbi:Cof-type HAD-IIB family hydrolase [Virgibacillus sp. W0430]|uniref:Cof-type HAD-IIB family hydrolase n=1 Tax=Virgibacillus sp. W0430 TaxID=3391580 RepID=UPI003F46238A
MNKDIKLVALDMDGTLLNNQLEVSPYTKKVIQQAMEKGVHVVLSTGRWLDICYPIAEELNLSTYMITSNGSEIWSADKKLLQRHLLDASVVDKMCAFADKVGIGTWLVSTEEVYLEGSRPDDLYAHEWLKMAFVSMNDNQIKQVKEELQKYGNLELSNSLPTNIEVNPEGINKASGLAWVCEKIGITMDEIMAVGDSLNDIRMIEEAGIGVAVGNAQEAVKNAADFVTDTNENDGVAKAIEKFVLK